MEPPSHKRKRMDPPSYERKRRYDRIAPKYCCHCLDGPFSILYDVCVSCNHELCDACDRDGVSTLSEDEVLESMAQRNSLRKSAVEQNQEHNPELEKEQKRRKLDMVKCDRCRIDKQKCSPSDRSWPAKCNRCIAKGFPCSDGKKLERKSKHALAKSPSPVPAIVDTTEHQSFLSEWLLFTGYYNNLTQAMEHLRDLQDNMFRCFQDPVPFRIRTRNTPSIDQLENRLQTVSKHLMTLADHHLETGRSVDTLPGPSILSSILSIPSFSSIQKVCLLCQRGKHSKIEDALEQSADIFSQLQFRQHWLESHFQAPSHLNEREKIGVEMSHYHKLTISITSLLQSHFKELGMDNVDRTSLFHRPEIGFGLSLGELELPDCLERTPLHHFLDSVKLEVPMYYLLWLKPWINKQDILGRAALHIACQKEWENRTDYFLSIGADPNLTTIYGSLPLHYAAASGNLGMCRKLIARMEPQNIGGKDCEGNTPLMYAKKNGHTEVVELLARHQSRQHW